MQYKVSGHKKKKKRYSIKIFSKTFRKKKGK